MNLEEAIEILRYHNAWRRGIEGYTMTNSTELGIAIDLIIKHFDELNNPKWISADDKEIPKDGEAYIAYMIGGQQDFVSYVSNDNGKPPYFRDYYYKEDVTKQITHWMPLLEKP